MNHREFWTEKHKNRDDRWVSSTNANVILSRLGVDLSVVGSVLEIGPGLGHMAEHLRATGRSVAVYDIVRLDVPGYVDRLPLEEPLDAAIAHLVLQHVPTWDQRELVQNVLSSLKPGGKLYFDAVSEDTGDNVALAMEYATGTSFPFTVWDLVTSKRDVGPGYFFCVAQA